MMHGQKSIKLRNLMFIHCSNSSSDILVAAHQNTHGH